MFRTLYHSFTLKTKLSVILIFSSLVLSLIAGVYFDYFLRKNFSHAAQERVDYAFARIQIDLNNVQKNLKNGILFIQDDEMLLASIDLINRYQDKHHYDVVLLDEEKKQIVERLLDQVKLTQNNDIVLYDARQELIAFVTKTPKGYYLSYVSYENARPVFYSRYENEYDYHRRLFKEHWLMRYKHLPYYTRKELWNQRIVTTHRYHNDLVFNVHQSLYTENRERLIAHIEMSKYISESYFKNLSEDMRMELWSSAKIYGEDRIPRLENDLFVLQEEGKRLVSSAAVETKNGDVVVHGALDTSELESTLMENRITFISLMLILTLSTLLLLRILFRKSVAQPLQTLMKQIEKIEHQDYSGYKIIRTGDELETISKNVNQLAFTLQEREQSLLKSQQELEDLSNTDPLTNLPNRRLFNALLNHAILSAERSKKKVAVIFLDLDQFKQVNDTLGHDIGDALLQSVARRLKETLRHSDLLARIGGDEFNILIEGLNERNDLQPLLEKLIDAFRRPFVCDVHEIRTTASIGISLFPEDGKSILELIKNADLAMYHSKDTGRNNYRFFTEELAHTIENRTTMVHALKNALETNDEFTLLYQPKISADTGKIAAVEGLIRWNSGTLGWVTPDRFIRLAEETGLIVPIGLWVIERSCRDFMQLRSEGFILHYMAINVSAIQLEKNDFFDTLQQIFDRTVINPEWLEIEITESYIATNVHHALETLAKLRKMKIKVAIDDFGTGYSSLSYLQKLSVDRLKIDKSFVDDLPDSSEGVAITRAIIALAKTFNLSITAEGVETKEQLDFLVREGCDEIQGYFYSKPLNLDALKTFLTSR